MSDEKRCACGRFVIPSDEMPGQVADGVLHLDTGTVPDTCEVSRLRAEVERLTRDLSIADTAAEHRSEVLRTVAAERDAAIQERDEAREQKRTAALHAAVRGIAMASEAQDAEIGRLRSRLEEAERLIDSARVLAVAYGAAASERAFAAFLAPSPGDAP